MLELNFHPFPILSTKRLVLRRIINDDAKELLTLRSDPAVMRFISRPLAQSIDDALDLIAIIDHTLNSNEGITWAITQQNNDILVGTIGFWRVVKPHHRAEIGYLLAPALQGKGIMHEALSAVLDYGFGSMKLHSIEAIVDPFNLASVKLLEKNNFVKEGSFKENFYFEGSFLNSDVYSLLTT
jgi:ribosomal-protein-alanine N-acetyltransferase